MSDSGERPVISEADVTPRSIERRTFLGRFGVAVGLMGIAGLTACGGGEASDADAAASDADASDADAAGGMSPDTATAPAPSSDSDSSDSDSG